jgi:hypothetical protein
MNNTPSDNGLPGNAEFQPGGVVERWLDAVFDGLTGTGSGGRRALAEIEDHLRESVTDGIGRGLERTEAERDAVTRIGPPERVARGIRATHRNLARPVLTGTWLLAGASMLALGVSTMLTAALQVTIDGHLDRNVCTVIRSPTSAPVPCGAGGAWHLGAEGLALVGIGLVVLGTLGILRRFTKMRAVSWLPRRRALAVTAVLFALVSLYLLGTPYTTFARQYKSESVLIPMGCAVVATAAAMLVPVWAARLRQSRSI